MGLLSGGKYAPVSRPERAAESITEGQPAPAVTPLASELSPRHPWLLRVPRRTRSRVRHPVLSFLVARIVAGVLTLFAASILIYGMSEILPGNVATAILGRTATPTATHDLELKLGLDRPFIVRYGDWVRGLVTGDLGNSAIGLAYDESNPSVSARVMTPLRNSVILALLAFMIFVPCAVALGIVAGVNAGKPIDYATSTTALALGALPEFVVATFLILIFFSGLDLFPPVVGFAQGEWPLAHIKQLILPVLTLVIVSMAAGMRMVRAGLVDVMRQDYVTMAYLNGFRRRRIIWRYGVRNAMAPSVVMLAQVAAYLVAGILVVENVFNYPGIGRVLLDAVKNRDVNVVQSVSIILAAVYILLNICADLIVVLLTPKLRTADK
jgi:peptide/nickel transport system permease protein